MTGRRLVTRRPGRESFRQTQVCRKLFLFGALLFSLAVPPAAAAPQIEALQRLDFGVLAITDNSAPSSVVLSPAGSAAYGTGYVFVAAATPGRYRLTGYPAYTDMTVSMAAPAFGLASGVPGETLSVSAAVTRPLVLHTDQNGQVEFDLGATLTTSGSGQPYPDGVYLGRPTLTLSFLVAGVPVESYQDVEVDVELRTSLALVEVESLDFSRLAVFASATDQATLTLAPNGAVTVVNAGTAKIVRFGGERPGTFRVSTGAAYAPVAINLPVGTVYLTHASQSADVARLLVTDFVSQPASGDAKLNAQGELEFRLGATLRTEQTTKPYQDGVYSGTFSLTVEY
jgi:hypothetical protein